LHGNDLKALFAYLNLVNADGYVVSTVFALLVGMGFRNKSGNFL